MSETYQILLLDSLKMKPYNTFLIFLLFLASFFVKSTEFTLSIGAVLNTNSRIGKEQKIAIKVAIRRFNSTSQFIILNSMYLRSDNPRRAASYAQRLIQRGAQVIISSGTWPQLLSISDVSKEAKIPTVSLAPSILCIKPFLIQLSYSESVLVKCLADLVKSYKWPQVIAVYEDDVYGTVSGTAQKLAYALQEVGASLEYSAVFPSMDSISDPTTIIQAELAQMRQCLSTAYIILRSSENLMFSLFREANTQRMMGTGSAWICGPDIITLLDSILNASLIMNHMQGVIGIEPYIKESEPEYIRFYSEFRQTFRSEYKKNGETSFNPGVYAVRAYDAFHAISLAANRSQENGNPLVDNLQGSNFTGLSGLVRPGSNEDMKEESDNSTFRVVNVVGKSYKEIGYWSEGFGFYKDESQLSINRLALQQLIVVLWPGETNIIPGGLRRLRVGVPINTREYQTYGFVIVDNKTNNYSGFCVEVFKNALGWLNSSILYDFVPFEASGVNITFDDFLYQVYSKNIDIAIGDITITSSRSENVSFTEPFIESALTMIVPLKNANGGFLLVKPFHWKLWVTFFGLLICNFASIWYLERAETGFNGPWYKQLGATFWIVGNTFFQNPGERIGNHYTKIVIISWLLVVLILSSSFTANLSSILVLEKLKPVVDKSMVGYENVQFAKDYVSVLNFKNTTPIKVEEFSSAFENGAITTAIMESPYARMFLSKHKNYTVHGDTKRLGGFGFALQKDDPLTGELSRAILNLLENDIIKQLEKKWFLDPFSESETTNSISAKQSLQLEEFWVLFLFGFAVVAITLATYMIHRCRHANTDPEDDQNGNDQGDQGIPPQTDQGVASNREEILIQDIQLDQPMPPSSQNGEEHGVPEHERMAADPHNLSRGTES